MNNLFLLPVANTPAETTPEGQPPVEGPVFATVLEEVEQAEASDNLEEKTTAAPEPLLVAVPLSPAPEPAQTPVQVQDRSTGTGSESGGPANSNVEAAAVKRPQASPQPAPGWALQNTTSQPPVTVQSPGQDQLPSTNPGIGKEREYTPSQEITNQPNTSPDLRSARQPAAPQDGQPVESPAQTPPQGSVPGVPTSILVPPRDLEGGGQPSEKIGRSPAFQEALSPGFTQEAGKEAFKPAAAPVAMPAPAPETFSKPLPKVGLRPPAAGADLNVESGTPAKTAVHGPKQGAETAPGERPHQQTPVPGGSEPMTIFVRQQPPVDKPVGASVRRSLAYQAPASADLAPPSELISDRSMAADEGRVYGESVQTRTNPKTAGGPELTDSLPVQRYAVQRELTPSETASGAAGPVPAEEAPALTMADPLSRQKAAYQAAVSKEKRAARPHVSPATETPRGGEPLPLEQASKTLSTQSSPLAPVNKPVAQANPVVVENPPLAPSTETNQPMVVDGSHQDTPGEPSALPEIKHHLPNQQEQTAPTREPLSPPNPWPAFGRAQAEISAGPLGTGTVLTHPLMSKPEEYPVNAPAETIFPSESAKLPQTEIPANEMPKPASPQTPPASLEKTMGEEFVGKSAQQLASAPVDEPETKAGVRKSKKGSPKAADPPKLDHIQRGEVGLNTNLTKVEVPQPVSEPARLAEAQATRIIKQLQNNILQAAQAGHTSLHLQLHPEDLGQIDLELTSRLDGLRITFTPDNPETGKLLAFYLKDLQQSLAEAGVQISGLSIGQNQTQGTARHDTWRDTKSKEAPTTQAGNDLKISGETGTDGKLTGWSSAVNYQI